MFQVFELFLSVFMDFFSFCFSFEILPNIPVFLILIFILIISFLFKALSKE